MPKTRLPKELWNIIRVEILIRDDYKCTRCHTPVTVRSAHIDHIRSGKHGSNRENNLRVLCRTCHTLRADMRHRGMIASALRDGIIPADWRGLVWE